ncbi:carboxymuconolactone decarboxylase family protein [Puniceicoccaceae bacterium K14]|nr:carboxymuconolactone decarboxylase family protein [Puniceicoccaceae bacterium K14]
MTTFTKHTTSTAPKGSSEILEKVEERYGFIPNLAAYLAESPAALGSLMSLAQAFDASSFTEHEQQIIQLTVSLMNGCTYCKTAHTALSRKADLDDETLQATIAFAPLPDAKQTTLRDFTRVVVENKGHVSEEELLKFLEAGYTQAQVFEVILGISMKTLTNYSNHFTGAKPNPEFIAMAEPATA